MRVALYALTGVGTDVFRAIKDKVEFVVTRREPGPYPHYICEQLDELARTHDKPVFYDAHPGMFDVDLLLCATFHQKIDARTRSFAKRSINLHPSLLPKHPGRNPFKAAIEAKDDWTGVTAHELTDEWDAGKIIKQWELAIPEQADEAWLRYSLAGLSAYAATRLVG